MDDMTNNDKTISQDKQQTSSEGLEQQKQEEHTEQEMVTITACALQDLKDKAGKAEEHYNNYLRSCADLENYRKRMQKEKVDYVKFANEKLLYELLSVLDSFDRAIAHTHKAEEINVFIEGLRLVERQLVKVFENYGVQEIQAAGAAFDPHLHEAVKEEQAADVPDGHIMDVLQKGYTLHGRLLRPAMVNIARGVTQPEIAPESVEKSEQ